jgi:hypothetical protein
MPKSQKLSSEQIHEYLTSKNPYYASNVFSVVNYYLDRKRALIRDEFGEMIVFRDSLRLGIRPSITCAIDKTSYFIAVANKVHSNYYDYSKAKFISSHVLMIIKCPIHGEFKQSYANHVLIGNHCPKCSKEILSQKLSSNTQEFIKKSIVIHGNKYNYSKVNYTKAWNKVEIICETHGSFFQTPNGHLYGYGCKECGYLLSNFRCSEWAKRGEDKMGMFYALLCEGNDEKFIKVGITYQSIEERYAKKSELPYMYKLIHLVESDDLEYIWRLERKVLINLVKYKYTPSISFAGMTECLDTSCINELKQLK